jgi:D-alanyl-lipoteichoic acid acyltransferase DltB (MBOAT superfamily)
MSLYIAATILLGLLSEDEVWTWANALFFLWELTVGYALLVHRLWDRRSV